MLCFAELCLCLLFLCLWCLCFVYELNFENVFLVVTKGTNNSYTLTFSKTLTSCLCSSHLLYMFIVVCCILMFFFVWIASINGFELYLWFVMVMFCHVYVLLCYVLLCLCSVYVLHVYVWFLLCLCWGGELWFLGWQALSKKGIKNRLYANILDKE